jgi:hypothetical protein
MKNYECVDFCKLNVATMKYPYFLSFIDEMNTIAKHGIYLFIYDFLGYLQISITPKDQYKIFFCHQLGAFIWIVMPFGVKNGLPTYQ